MSSDGTAERKRAEAMARAASRAGGWCEWDDVEPSVQGVLIEVQLERAAALDAYFANTEFKWTLGEGLSGTYRFKPEPVDE